MTEINTYKELLDKIDSIKSQGKSDPEAAEIALRRIIQTQPKVAQQAAEALIQLRGLPLPRGSLLDRAEDHGPETLSREELTVHLVDMFGYYTENLFIESMLEERGHLLKRMAEALRTVGAPHSASLLDSIISLLPQLSPDLQERKKQISALPDNTESAIIQKIKTHISASEDPILLAMQFELDNASGFQRM